MTDRNREIDLHRMVELAREVRENAYSPFSGAKVGAAVMAADGRIFTGCNIENASYGLTQCAERNALSAAIAAGVSPGSLGEIVIVASGFDQLSPCGACRQVMVELMSEDAVVHSCDESGTRSTWTIQELFPHPFSLE